MMECRGEGGVLPVLEALFFELCHLVPSLGFVPCNGIENVCKKKLKKTVEKKNDFAIISSVKGKLYRECL
jgi:hypothetical protein